jgi:hypothetical protein
MPAAGKSLSARPVASPPVGGSRQSRQRERWQRAARGRLTLVVQPIELGDASSVHRRRPAVRHGASTCESRASSEVREGRAAGRLQSKLARSKVDGRSSGEQGREESRNRKGGSLRRCLESAIQAGLDG